MATAADRALNVAELLERILLQLPMKDILLDQRVAKFWRDLVKSSPKLQQTLFYRPDYDVETWTAIKWTDHCDRSTPVVVEAVTPEARRDFGVSHDTIITVTEISDGDCKLRITSADTYEELSECSYWDDRVECSHDEDFASKGWSRMMSTIPSKDCKPTWHDMYLTQPPATEVTFYDYYGTESPLRDECDRDSGVTCGDLMEGLTKRYGKQGVLHFHHLQLNIWDSVIRIATHYDIEVGIAKFARLAELTGSRDAALSLCERIHDDVWWLLQNDNYKKIERHGWMDRVEHGCNFEELLWECDHMPECMGGECVGCRTSITA